MATTNFTFGGMNNLGDPANVGIPDTSLRVQDRAYTACTDIVNCLVDNDLNAIARPGRQLVTAADVTSAWSDGTRSFAVANGLLHLFDGSTLAVLGNSPTLQPVVEFCQVNDMVVFSDDRIIGLIDQQNVYYPITAPAEAVDILDLETWVKLTYPAGEEADASNLDIDAFRITTLAGHCLEFFNGALYLATENWVFCTKTFDVEHMDIRYNVVAGFRGSVTGVRAVTDGLYIGTTEGVYFLAGNATYVAGESLTSISKGFTQRRLLPFGMVMHSAQRVAASKITELKARDNAVVWLTADGVYAGGDGGAYLDLTDAKMALPTGEMAAATICRSGEAWLYKAVIDGEAVVVNLSNTAHSRYTNYDFAALFHMAGHDYGANSAGVFLLEGATDAGTDIEASFTTPIVDFGVPQLKRVTDLYLHARTTGSFVVDLFVDEQEVATEIPFTAPLNLAEGVRRFRAKLPRGAKGTNWQFRIYNVDGAPFTAFSLKAMPVVSARSI